MDSQISPVPTTPQAPQKSRKMIWLWIFLGFACLCLCLIIPLVAILRDPTWLNILDTGAPQVKISAGTYNGTIYTAPTSNFSCDFGNMMVPGFSPVLQDTTFNLPDGSAVGVGGQVWTTDDEGNEYGVVYFQLSNKNTIATDKIHNTEGDLKVVFNDIFLRTPQGHHPGTQVLDQKFVGNDRLLDVFYVPQGSSLTSSPASDPNTKTVMDLIESDYALVAGQWLYFVFYGRTPDLINTPTPWSPDDTQAMQGHLDTFVKGCNFK